MIGGALSVHAIDNQALCKAYVLNGETNRPAILASGRVMMQAPMQCLGERS